RAFERIGSHLKERVDETERLGPLFLGIALERVREVLGALSGERRFKGMARRPPNFGGESIAQTVTDGFDGRGKQRGFADSDHFGFETLLAHLRDEGAE